MLQSLHVKNIALIDEVEIDFTQGLNILTGETGAGKSILIDSVNFALGERMPKDIVRDGADYGLVELIFNVEEDSVRNVFLQKDIAIEDDTVILSRKITNGKSICKCNGETVPAAVIKEIASLLIDIHGQHEHQSLLYKKNHKLLLDSFCGDDFNDELCKLKNIYQDYKKLEKEYDDAVKSSVDRQKDIDYTAFVVNEIESAHLKEGEDEQLESDFSRMNSARKLNEIIGSVKSALSSDREGAGAYVSHAVSMMKSAAGIDSQAEGIFEQLKQVEEILSDCSRLIDDYEESLEFEPEEFSAVEERLDEINRLKMKYGQSIAEILKRLDEETQKLEKLNDYDNYIANLLCKKDESYDILKKACLKISEIRKKEARRLSHEIEEALNNLNFLEAKFEIKIESDEDNIESDGFDDVEFMISTNPGEQVRPLTQVASGGELSRIMLALKSVLAKRDSIGTLIFDEIDTGISGKTAQRVADRMSDIAASHQVICITHLPQIASHATSHYLIEKSTVGAHTSTKVSMLSYEDSIEELSRMLAGETITDAVRENAREMKKQQG